MCPLNPPSRPRGGFTILELLAAMAILSMILMVILSLIQQTGNAWKGSRSKAEAFQEARLAFENITRSLSQATLNTYYDYYDAAGRPARDPDFSGAHHYGRQSDLHFVTGKALVHDQVGHALFFQTPAGYAGETKYTGIGTLLNAFGYYILHSQDTLRPKFLDENTVPNAPENATRYRLMQFVQPSEQLAVYNTESGSQWFQDSLAGDSPPIQQLAANVIALVILPRQSAGDAAASTPLTDDYEYDTRLSSGGSTQLKTENQLPPLVEIIMVAIDEVSARRLGDAPAPEVSFDDPDQLEANLTELERKLNEQRLSYRIFRTTVPLRNSKWSSQ